MIPTKDLEHGEEIQIQYKTFEGWSPGWFGTYLTTENRGHGPQLLVKEKIGGEHLRVSPHAEDVKITRA